MSQRYYISWDEFHQDTELLAARLMETGRSWEKLVAITRGGLVPTAILAQKLNIRHIETICVVSYDDKDQQRETKIIKDLPVYEPGLLIIDDLVDTGRTFNLLLEKAPHAHCAAVYAKPLGAHTAHTYAKAIAQETWIVFPWENDTNSQK